MRPSSWDHQMPTRDVLMRRYARIWTTPRGSASIPIKESHPKLRGAYSIGSAIERDSNSLHEPDAVTNCDCTSCTSVIRFSVMTCTPLRRASNWRTAYAFTPQCSAFNIRRPEHRSCWNRPHRSSFALLSWIAQRSPPSNRHEREIQPIHVISKVEGARESRAGVFKFTP